LRRSLSEAVRGKAALVIKVVRQVSLGLIYGGIYKLGNDQSLDSRLNWPSLVNCDWLYQHGYGGDHSVISKEKNIITGEIGSKLYKTLPYFLAKAIAEIPLLAAFSALFSGIRVHVDRSATDSTEIPNLFRPSEFAHNLVGSGWSIDWFHLSQ
jgi:hypothetical protein